MPGCDGFSAQVPILRYEAINLVPFWTFAPFFFCDTLNLAITHYALLPR